MTDKNNAMPLEFSKLGNELSKKFELGFSAEILYNKVAEKITAGKQQTVSPNDVYSFMLECKTLNLNPLAKHIYGFLQGGKVCTIVSIDGWREIANREPNYDGYEFVYGDCVQRTLAYDTSDFVKGVKVPKQVSVERKVYEWIECKVYLKNRTRPVAFRTYFDEAFRPSQPWACQPIQMLQNKALVNAIKNAFSISAYTEDDRDFMETETPTFTPVPEKQTIQYEVKNIPQKEQKQEQQAGFLNIEEPTF